MINNQQRGQYNLNEEDIYQRMYFKKDDALGIAPHFHDSVEMIFILEGEAIAYVDGKEMLLKPGQICYVESYKTHCYKQVSDKIMAYVLVLSRDYITIFRENYPSLTFESFLLDINKNKPIFEFLDYWFERRNNLYIFNCGMAITLYSELVKAYSPIARENYSGDSVIKEILQYIHEHFTEDISLKSISHEFGYTVEYCSKIISKATRTNFRSYLNLLRIRKVNELLADKSLNYSIQEAVYKAGFASPATYYRIKGTISK